MILSPKYCDAFQQSKGPAWMSSEFKNISDFGILSIANTAPFHFAAIVKNPICSKSPHSASICGAEQFGRLQPATER